MKEIEFYKMSGSGNDFIIIDNRDSRIKDEDMSMFSKLICRRRISVGADGVIFIKKSNRYDFSWRFFNADGSEAEMCGNGSRCAARFAYINNIAPKQLIFETIIGPISAQVSGRRVKVLLSDPEGLRLNINVEAIFNWDSIDFINTGVPHVVIRVNDIDNVPVVDVGRKIRFHKLFSPDGTNVNFMKSISQNLIEIRTYERGVEDETLACGTGAIACALISSIRDGNVSPVDVKTRGGEVLRIYFKKEDNRFSDIWLEGDTNIIYKGRLHKEALY